MSSQLLINEPPLQVLPTLARSLGLNEAIILQQVHYWLNPRFNRNWIQGRLWVRNTYEQWQKQFSFWREKTIRRAIGNLEEAGVLDSFVTSDFKKTKYYTINYEVLASRQEEKDDLPSPGSLPENTLEMTERENLPLKMAENQGARPSGQNDRIDLPKQADRRGQVDQTDLVNVTRLYTKDTETTDPETTLPPLSPPSSQNDGQKESSEEEEEEKGRNQAEEDPGTELGQGSLAGAGARGSSEEEREKGNPGDGDRVTGLGQGFLPLAMVEVWNQTVQDLIQPGSQAQLTPPRETLLKEFWDRVLEPEEGTPKLQSWKNYCTLIARSQFLTGKGGSGFRVTLDWVLNPHNACKVLEGKFFDKPALVWHNSCPPSGQGALSPQPWEEFAQELIQASPPGPYQEDWIRISLYVAKTIGQQKYKSWISRAVLSAIAGPTATIQVEGAFTREYIYNNFRAPLLQAVQRCHPSVRYLQFQVAPQAGNPE